MSEDNQDGLDPKDYFLTIDVVHPKDYFMCFIICYNKNTPIKCLINNKETFLKIQDLKVGMNVITLDGPKVISKVTHHIQRNDKNDKNRMFQYKNLLLSGRHRTIVKDKPDEKINPRKYDIGYSVPCSHDPRFSEVESNCDFHLYNFSLKNDDKDHRDIIDIKGILVETTSEWYLSKVK